MNRTIRYWDYDQKIYVDRELKTFKTSSGEVFSFIRDAADWAAYAQWEGTQSTDPPMFPFWIKTEKWENYCGWDYFPTILKWDDLVNLQNIMMGIRTLKEID